MGTRRVIHYILGHDLKDREGKWLRNLSASYDGVERRVTTRMGVMWDNLLQRTRESPFQGNKPTYSGCTNGFTDFSSFCEFCSTAKGFGMIDKYKRQFALDKDILGDGKEYNDKVCCFVPLNVNNCFLEKGGIKLSSLPAGITIHQSKYRVRDGNSGRSYSFNDLCSAIIKKRLLKAERLECLVREVYYDQRIIDRFRDEIKILRRIL